MKNKKPNQKKLMKIAQAEKVFRNYFDSYYSSHRTIRNISYRVMEDNDGYCVRLEYENFAQYINYYYTNAALSDTPAMVNACFEFEYNNEKFLCHFVDVLDAIDSDDISFYTYPKCAKDEDIENAVQTIMAASEKYMDSLNAIAVSESMKKQIFDSVYDDELEEDDEAFRVEDMWDDKYFIYGSSLMTIDELRKMLNKQNRKGKLEKGYETRAYRVLSNLDRSEIKARQKQKKSLNNYSKKDRILMYSPYIAAAVVFAVVFGIIGYEIDKNMFAQYIGKTHWESAIGLGAAGAGLSVIIIGLLEQRVYKLIVKKDYYDQFMQVVKTEAVPKWLEILLYVLLIVFAAFFVSVFCFNGIFFTPNGDVVNKEFAFSQAETYSIQDVDIAVVEASPESEYIDTAYAFRFDGDWIEYGVPDDESKKFIENSIEKYNINTIKTDTFDSLE